MARPALRAQARPLEADASIDDGKRDDRRQRLQDRRDARAEMGDDGDQRAEGNGEGELAGDQRIAERPAAPTASARPPSERRSCEDDARARRGKRRQRPAAACPTGPPAWPSGKIRPMQPPAAKSRRTGSSRRQPGVAHAGCRGSMGVTSAPSTASHQAAKRAGRPRHRACRRAAGRPAARRVKPQGMEIAGQPVDGDGVAEHQPVDIGRQLLAVDLVDIALLDRKGLDRCRRRDQDAVAVDEVASKFRAQPARRPPPRQVCGA